MNELALFAGAGGGILGGKILGWRTVCAVEREPYAAGVLIARQNDGSLPPFPIWDDVCTFDGRPWRGIVDVVSGGFPCQDISVAGKGAGIDGERSGLWGEMARIIGEVRPRFAFVENSPALVNRGLGRVLGDLAALGYDCRWTVLSAADVGAPHRRERIWIVARRGDRIPHSEHDGIGWGQQQSGGIEGAEIVANARFGRLGEQDCGQVQQQGRAEIERASDATDAQRGAVRDAPSEDVESEIAIRPLAGVHGGDEYVADTARVQPGRTEQRAERQRTGTRGESVAGVADANGQRQLQQAGTVGEVWRRVGDGGDDGKANGARLEKWESQRGDTCEELAPTERADWWEFEPDVGRVAHGVAARVDRLKAIGNGQVPQCAAEAWRMLTA